MHMCCVVSCCQSCQVAHGFQRDCNALETQHQNLQNACNALSDAHHMVTGGNTVGQNELTRMQKTMTKI